MKRADLVSRVSAALGPRDLVWFGTRGDDVESAVELPQLSAAYSIIGRYERRDSVVSEALERLTGSRVDLDSYELDDHLAEEPVRALRNQVLSALSGPSALFTYRPSTFLSAISFARADRCGYLGMFKDHQTAFEHKPWVESAVRTLGVPHVPWTYIADEEQLRTLTMLEDGPVMLRTSRSSGGTGVVKVHDAGLLRAAWMTSEESFVSVAPYIEDAVPLNVAGVVWRDGITVHPASIQLIGHPALTLRPFGYCGNDFAAFASLPPDVIAAVENSTVCIGLWLRTHGYIGAYGVDFLLKDGLPLFTEINPRFQGSTHLSCRIAVELGESCLLLEHLAAHLGLPAPKIRPLSWWAANAPPSSHVVIHNTGVRTQEKSTVIAQLRRLPGLKRVDVIAPGEVSVEPNATLARVTVGRSVTTSGFDLAPELLTGLTKLPEARTPVSLSSSTTASRAASL